MNGPETGSKNGSEPEGRIGPSGDDSYRVQSGIGMVLTPNERALRARLAAHALHAGVDSRQHTEPARRAFMARFEDEVDPDRTLPPAERARRAEHAKKSYFTRLALQSAQARRRR